MTYMNLSGESVRAFIDYYKQDIADGMIVYDDLDTEIGKLRLRYQGSAGATTELNHLLHILIHKPSIVSAWAFLVLSLDMLLLIMY